MRILVNDKVALDDKRTGTVRYFGTVKFARGEWVGIALDNPFVGKNDGEVKGKRYFKCPRNRGTFVRKERVVEVKCAASSSIAQQETSLVDSFKVGSRVSCDERLGTVRFIGVLSSVRNDSYLGVELDPEFKGNSDGIRKGKLYFSCAPGQGIFIKPEKARPVIEKSERKQNISESLVDKNLNCANLEEGCNMKQTTSSNQSCQPLNVKSKTEYTILEESASCKIPLQSSIGDIEKLSNRACPTRVHGKENMEKTLKPELGMTTNNTMLQVSEDQWMIQKGENAHMEHAVKYTMEAQNLKADEHEHSKKEWENQQALIKQNGSEDIMEQRDALKLAGKECVSSESLTHSSELLRVTDTELREAQAKLAENERQAQRNRELMNKEREQILEDTKLLRNERKNFSTEKVKLIEDRKRLEKVAREMESEFKVCRAKYDMVQKQLTTSLEKVAFKTEECTSLQQELKEALNELAVVKKVLESERKITAEQNEEQREALKLEEEKKVLQEKLLQMHTELADVKKMLVEKIQKSERNSLVIVQDQAKVKESELLLKDTRSKVETRDIDAENESEKLKELIEQNRREQDEMAAQRNEIKKEKMILAQAQSTLRKERDDFECWRGRLEGMVTLDDSNSKNNLQVSHRKTFSQYSLSSQNHDSTMSLGMFQHRLSTSQKSLSNLELSGSSSWEGWEEKEVEEAGSGSLKNCTKEFDDFVPGDREIEYSPSWEPGAYYDDMELSSRSLLRSHSDLPRNESNQQDHELSSIVFSRHSAKSRKARTPREKRRRGRRRIRQDSQSANGSPRSNMWDGFSLNPRESLNGGATDSEVYATRCDSSDTESDLSSQSEQSSKTVFSDSIWFMHPEDQLRNSNRDVVNQVNDPKHKYSSEVGKIEAKLKSICEWIIDTKRNISTLPDEPCTFDEIVATIESLRTKKIQDKLMYVAQLTEQHHALTEANATLVREHYFDKTEEIVALEKWCERELKKIEQSSSDKLSKAAVQFKKNLPQIMNHYWEQAGSLRQLMQAVLDKCEQTIPDRYDTIAIARSSLEEAVENERLWKDLKEKMVYLKKMGVYIGKIRSSEAQDCLNDAINLNIIYDSTTNNLAKRSITINQKCKHQLDEVKSQRMKKIDEVHKAKYLEIMDSVDKIMGELAECGKSRNQEKLSTDCTKINRILNEDLPKWRNFITSQLAKASTYLRENGYGSARLVGERDKSAKEMLQQAEQRAAKLQAEVLSLLS